MTPTNSAAGRSKPTALRLPRGIPFDRRSADRPRSCTFDIERPDALARNVQAFGYGQQSAPQTDVGNAGAFGLPNSSNTACAKRANHQLTRTPSEPLMPLLTLALPPEDQSLPTSP